MASDKNAKKDLNGVERAAVLLMTLGEQDAAQILKHMSPKEVQAVGEAMAGMTSLNKETVNYVLDDFCSVVDEQTALGIGSERSEERRVGKECRSRWSPYH